MVKVRIKATKEDIEKAEKDQGDFVLPPPGIYVLTMSECNSGYSKTNGDIDKQKPRLECIYSITGIGPEDSPTKENYGKVWDYVSFSEAAGWKRAEFLRAFKLLKPGQSEADVEIDTDDFTNRKVIARLKHESGQSADDPKKAKVARLIAYGSDMGASDTEDSAPDYGGDAPAGDAPAFGESTEDDSPYTVDELDLLDLKELGRILREEFEGDPNEHLVKSGKKVDMDSTKENVINAILEAQGDSDSADEDDDESPF